MSTKIPYELRSFARSHALAGRLARWPFVLVLSLVALASYGAGLGGALVVGLGGGAVLSMYGLLHLIDRGLARGSRGRFREHEVLTVVTEGERCRAVVTALWTDRSFRRSDVPLCVIEVELLDDASRARRTSMDSERVAASFASFDARRTAQLAVGDEIEVLWHPEHAAVAVPTALLE